MYTIIAKDNRITAVDFETLRADLVNELFHSGKEDITEWQDWVEKVYPPDSSEVDDDYIVPTPRPLTQDNLESFAAWIFDTPSARLIQGEPPAAQTLQALHEFIGWSLDDAADHLDVAKRTYQRWLSGQMVAPSKVEGELRRVVAHTIERAKLLADSGTIDFSLEDDGAERRAHALAEAMFTP